MSLLRVTDLNESVGCTAVLQARISGSSANNCCRTAVVLSVSCAEVP